GNRPGIERQDGYKRPTAQSHWRSLRRYIRTARFLPESGFVHASRNWLVRDNRSPSFFWACAGGAQRRNFNSVPISGNQTDRVSSRSIQCDEQLYGAESSREFEHEHVWSNPDRRRSTNPAVRIEIRVLNSAANYADNANGAHVGMRPIRVICVIRGLR